MTGLSRSKSLAFAFLLGAFATGGATGFAAGRTSAPEPSPTRGRAYSERSMRQELARDLGLTVVQQATFDSIFDWRKRRYRELMDPIRPALDSARDSARVLMMQQLDSVQREAFTRMLDRPRRRSDGSRESGSSQER